MKSCSGSSCQTWTHLSIEPVANNGISGAKAQVVTYLEITSYLINICHTSNAILDLIIIILYSNILIHANGLPGMLSQNVQVAPSVLSKTNKQKIREFTTNFTPFLYPKTTDVQNTFTDIYNTGN